MIFSSCDSLVGDSLEFQPSKRGNIGGLFFLLFLEEL